MLKVRIMPTLLHKDIGLVKGFGFDSSRRVGTAMQAVKVYNTELRTIPGRWWAGLLYPEMEVRENFSVEESVQQNPEVKF